MEPRPGRPAPRPPARPATRPAARPAARSRPMEDRIDSMRVGGFVMLALAALEIVEKVVLSFWLDIDKDTGITAASAFFDALLGVAMLQGSNAARKVVLWLTGLSLLAVLAALGLVVMGGFGHIWPIAAGALLLLLGVFVLNLSPEQSRAVVIGSLALIVVGWVGSVAASVVLAGTVDLSTMQLIRQWSAPDRSYENAEAGLSVRIPPTWVALKDGAPITEEDKPLVSLVNTEVLCTAAIRREARGSSVVDTLDYFLDNVAKTMESKQNDFQAIERTDGRIGGLPARRMKAAWRQGDTEVHGYFTAWNDSDLYYTLEVSAPRIITRRLSTEVEALERSVEFSAPWTAFLRDKGGPTCEACPLLTKAVVLTLARKISTDAAPEAYCREAYRLAFIGQLRLDAASKEALASRMRAFFAAMPGRTRDRFGAYVERIRAGQPPAAAEDKEMMQITQAAVQALAPEAQDELRRLFALAVDTASFGERLGLH